MEWIITLVMFFLVVPFSLLLAVVAGGPRRGVQPQDPLPPYPPRPTVRSGE